MTTYTALTELPRLEDIRFWFQNEVLVADARLDQARVRAAAEVVFAAHPALGTMYEPFLAKWMTRHGGGWGWAVEPPGVAIGDVIDRQRATFDMRTGRLFAVSLLPGARDRLVLTASYLCADRASWRVVVDDLMSAYGGGVLRREEPAGLAA
jgi:hypothetical protein